MAMEVSEVMEWLDKFQPDDLVAIDEGGTTLVLNDCYLEVGGVPEDDDEEQAAPMTWAGAQLYRASGGDV